MTISLSQLTVLLLIIARMAGVFIEAPIFSSRSFPVLGKSALIVWLALVLWFVVPINNPPDLFSLPALAGALVFEVAIGFLIGFIANLILISIQAGGEIIDLQMGLSVASALDPIFGAVISIIGKLSFYIALVIFITSNGHHLVLSALYHSFTVLPLAKVPNLGSPALVLQLSDLVTQLWSTAIRLAAPAVLLIFLADFSFGIVSRGAPQVNVFMLGFQVKPLLGLFTIITVLPFIITYINNLMVNYTQQMAMMLNAIK